MYGQGQIRRPSCDADGQGRAVGGGTREAEDSGQGDTGQPRTRRPLSRGPLSAAGACSEGGAKLEDGTVHLGPVPPRPGHGAGGVLCRQAGSDRWRRWADAAGSASVVSSAPSGGGSISEPDGRMRPLAIGAPEDEIIRGAAVAVVNEICRATLLGFPCGSRPGSGISLHHVRPRCAEAPRLCRYQPRLRLMTFVSAYGITEPTPTPRSGHNAPNRQSQA